MKHLYPAQKSIIFSLLQYAVLAFTCLFSFLFSYSQRTDFKNASVDLVSFTAQAKGSDKVMLSLVTGSETDFSHFVIQRSMDNVNFDDAGIIFSEEENTSSEPRYYFFSDNTDGKSTVVYYRLKLVNVKEAYSFSDTIVCNTMMSGIFANINPQQNKLKISIPENWSGKTVNYLIYSASEKMIKQELRNSAAQTEIINIADLPTGRYIIKATNGKDSSEQKIVKLNRYS